MSDREPPVSVTITGHRADILVDGQPVAANRIRGINIQADVHGIPTVTLTLIAPSTRFVADRAKVVAELEPLGITIIGRACACDCHDAEAVGDA